jgi:levanase
VLFVDRRNSGITGAGPYCSRYETPCAPGAVPGELRVLIDASSVEMFACDGATHMAAFVLPDPSARAVQLSASAPAACRVRVSPYAPEA